MRNFYTKKLIGITVYTSVSEPEAEHVCNVLKKHFAMPIYFEVEYDQNQYLVLFNPWDGYLGNTSGYVDEIKRYVTKIQ